MASIVMENFPNDRVYTLNALVEELALLERHIRDGSWQLCTCNPEKHLPLIAGLASEGFGFAESPDEKTFMNQLMSQARVYREKITKGELRTQNDMEEMRSWSREMRHRLVLRKWTGELMGEADITPEVKAVIGEIIDKLQRREAETSPEEHMHTHFDPDKYLRMERQLAEEMLRDLSEEHGVEPPEIVISDKCHEPSVGKYRSGKIYVCKSGVSLHILAHEFAHHLQNSEGGHFWESEAEDYSVDLFKPKKTLYYEKNHDGIKMMSLNDIAVVYGGQHIGQGLERLLEFLDTQYPAGLMGIKPSLLGDVLATAGGAYMAMELDPPYDLLAALIGGHLSTDLWEQAEEMMGGTQAAFGSPSYKYTSTPQSQTQKKAVSGYTKSSYAVQ